MTTNKIAAQFPPEPSIPVTTKIKVSILVLQEDLERIEAFRKREQPAATQAGVIGWAVGVWSKTLQ
jgi:hypothetical protein